MASFNTDHIIYPYDTFADYLSNAISLPSNYLLHQWLTSPRGTPLSEPVFPPRGRWILCGFGRFGKSVHQKLVEHGLDVTVIAEHHEMTCPPEGSIEGRGTEAETLEQAGIGGAVGVIAGTDHDVNNLSIIMTAKSLQPNLFTIGRQEFASNNLIFDAANINLVTNHSNLISSEVLALINTPLTADFLRLSRQQSEQWSRELVSRLLGCIEEDNPSAWVITISTSRCASLVETLNAEQEVLLHHIAREPQNRKKKLPCVALMLRRGGESMLLPDEKTPLKPFDRLLFAGNPAAKRTIDEICASPDLLHYMITGSNRARGSLWNWIDSRKSAKPTAAD